MPSPAAQEYVTELPYSHMLQEVHSVKHMLSAARHAVRLETEFMVVAQDV